LPSRFRYFHPIRKIDIGWSPWLGLGLEVVSKEEEQSLDAFSLSHSLPHSLPFYFIPSES